MSFGLLADQSFIPSRLVPFVPNGGVASPSDCKSPWLGPSNPNHPSHGEQIGGRIAWAPPAKGPNPDSEQHGMCLTDPRISFHPLRISAATFLSRISGGWTLLDPNIPLRQGAPTVSNLRDIHLSWPPVARTVRLYRFPGLKGLLGFFLATPSGTSHETFRAQRR